MREHCSLLPRFDEWGIVPKGHRRPRSNPWAAQPEQMGESPEPDEEEDSGEDEASGGADPSGGFASSSRSVPPEEDLQVISSSSDEEPPRRAAVEEKESGNKGGRHESRSKLAHDRDAGAARDVRREEAGAPREGARANSPQPPKANKRVWKNADE